MPGSRNGRGWFGCSQAVAAQPLRQDSEIGVTGLGSFGHYHLFANSWWSYLDMAGVEYDRHSWGYKAGARMDYTAELDPMVLLWQPSKTDVWGNPQSKSHELVYGIGVAPIGLRMTWRSRKNIRPYYLMRGGLLAFDKKGGDLAVCVVPELQPGARRGRAVQDCAAMGCARGLQRLSLLECVHGAEQSGTGFDVVPVRADVPLEAEKPLKQRQLSVESFGD